MGDYPGQFETFWAAYPKKRAKLDALKAWTKLRPSGELVMQILSAVESQKQSRDWKKDDRQWVPYPATWLRNGQWTDELEFERRGVQRTWQESCEHQPKCGNATKCDNLQKIAAYKAQQKAST